MTTVTDDAVVPVLGTTSERFAPLGDVVARVVAEQGEGGVSVAVYHHGEPVADLTVGDRAEDALQLVFSVSKAVSTIGVATLVDDGRFDVDRPLAAVWPELDRSSTRGITARMVLDHTSGLAAITAPITRSELLAGADDHYIGLEAPLWEPGSARGYHAHTFGTLLDGAIRRTLGTDLRSVVAGRVAAPLGAAFRIGADVADLDRVARVRIPPRRRSSLPHPGLPTDRIGPAFDTVPDNFDRPDYLTANFPAGTGVGDARGLAAIMAATLPSWGGPRIVDPATVRAFTAPRSGGVDRMLGIPIANGTGFQLPFPQFPMISAASYGHEAYGGSAVVADPVADLAIAFVTDTVHPMGASRPSANAVLQAARVLAA